MNGRYDDIIVDGEESAVVQGPTLEPVKSGRYDDIILSESEETEARARNVQSSFNQSLKYKPETAAKHKEMANKTGFGPDVIDRNYDKLADEQRRKSTNYNKLVAKNPSTSKWLSNSMNAGIAQDEVDHLSKVEDVYKFGMPPKDEPFYNPLDLSKAVATGQNTAAIGGVQLALTSGKITPAEAAEMTANLNAVNQDLRDSAPDYVGDFEEAMSKEGDEVSQAFAGLGQSYEAVRKELTLNSILDVSGYTTRSIAESLDFAYEISAKRPRGLSYFLTENLTRVAPTFLATWLGGGAGAAGGAQTAAAVAPFTGPYAPLVTSGLVAGGATLGAGAGALAAGTAQEMGAWIDQEVRKQVKDPTDAAELLAVYSDPVFMKRVREEGFRKGLTTAAIGSFGSMFAGKLLSKVKGAKYTSKSARVKAVAGAGAKELGIQSVEEGVGEGAGQYMAVGKVDPVEVLSEMTLGVASGAPNIAIGMARRSNYSTQVDVAVEQMAEENQEANQAIVYKDKLDNLVDLANESKTNELSPESFNELMHESNAEAPQNVFFQSDEWDEYWTAKGEDPVAKAEEMLRDPEAYHKAKENGLDIEISLPDYISNAAANEDVKDLNKIARSSSSSMNSVESESFKKNSESTLNELKIEAEAELSQDQKLEEYKGIIKEQLVAAGQSVSEANINKELINGFRAFADRTGTDINEIIAHYGLKVEGVEGEFLTGEIFEQAKDQAPEVKEQIRSVNAQSKDPKSTKILAQDQKGRIGFGKDDKTIIQLLDGADKSTFIHEMGHFYFKLLGDMAAKPEAHKQIKDDLKTLLDWFEVDSIDQVTVEHQEKFATAFEAYTMEGKAPSIALRKAFRTFKTWLIDIYKAIAPNATLNKDVREVMNRMMATDIEIKAATQKINMGSAMGSNPEAFGLTGKAAERMRQAHLDALGKAEEILSDKVMGSYKRKHSADYRAKREKEKEVVTEEVNNSHLYLLVDALTKNNSSFVINEASIDALLSPAEKKKLPKKMYSKGSKNDVDVVASLFGYTSGLEMLEQIAGRPKKEQLIEILTDQVMAQKYPDADPIYDQELMKQQAIDAVHNEQYEKLMDMEFKIIAKEYQSTLKAEVKQLLKPPKKSAQVRDDAIAYIDSQAIGEIKPIEYQRAEAKNNKLAGEAYLRGDLEKSYEYIQKRNQNYYLYKAATQAKGKVKKSLKQFKKLNKKDEDIAKTRELDYVDAARGLLARFGLAKGDKSPLEHLSKVKDYDPDKYESLVTLVASVESMATDLESLTYAEFKEVAQVVDSLWNLAKDAKQITIDGKKMSKEKAITELSVGLHEFTKEGVPPGADKALTDMEKTKFKLLGWMASLTRVEHFVELMDMGDIEGPWRKYVYAPIKNSIDKYKSEKTKEMDVLKGIIEKLKESGSLTFKEIKAPELGYTFTHKAHLLSALIHIGNDSNKQKLLRGYGWGEFREDKTLDDTAWVNFTNRLIDEGVLTKADFDFAQEIWDFFDKFKSGAQKAHKSMYGHYFDEITANEFTNKYGTYKGGYVPALADPSLVEDAQIRQDKETITKHNNAFAFPTTGRGATKSRVEQYAAKLMLDLGAINRHLDWTLRFTHVEPAVKDVSKIMTDKGFRSILYDFNPKIASKLFMPWLQKAATQRSSELVQASNPFKDWADLSKVIKSNVGLSLMFLNVKNAMEQYAGYTTATLKVKSSYLLKAKYQMTKNPELIKALIDEKSPFMKERVYIKALDIQRDMKKLIEDTSPYSLTKDKIRTNGYILQQITQDRIDKTVWYGAYEQAKVDGFDDKQAVKKADSAVRLTQGSFDVEDRANFETQNPFAEMVFMFANYFNGMANLAVSQGKMSIREKGAAESLPRLLHIYAVAFMIPATFSAMLSSAVKGNFDEDEDDEYMDDFLDMFFNSQFDFATSMLPVSGKALAAVKGQFDDKWYNDDLQVSPVVGVTSSTLKGIARAGKALTGDKDVNKARLIKDLLMGTSLVTGIPVAPISKPIRYLMDVNSGKAKPSGPIDFTRGLITGYPGQ